MYSSANSGNLSTRPNRTASWTNDPVESPVSKSTLADFLGVDATDPLLQGLLDAATAAVIDYTGVQVIERDWHWQSDRYPERQPAMTGVGANGALPAWWIDLPAWPATGVTSVTAESFEFDERTNRLWVTRPVYPLTVDYTAGYSTTPAVFMTAITMMAAYLYEHRGGCDAGNAGHDSGAFGMLRAHRRYGGGL